ncbi:hypothetical protein chiPu_0029461 [Chiloscyllium punctatum]|uniref:Uncharacterized protein n=1 Tax=Chiloscyllium punctatum TaxID=137246 RepID=A0A401TRS5_CHIPU|nr:hypothetical protein [Chiloscyllium punctatum]
MAADRSGTSVNSPPADSGFSVAHVWGRGQRPQPPNPSRPSRTITWNTMWGCDWLEPAHTGMVCDWLTVRPVDGHVLRERGLQLASSLARPEEGQVVPEGRLRLDDTKYK